MKKKTLTNRELSEKTNIPIGKIRRNTKEFLGGDPRATKRSGYKREISINNGFFVYLGTYLVSKFGLTFDNARKAIFTIKPWLLKNGFVPDRPKKVWNRGIDREIKDYFVTFIIYKGKIIEICEIKGIISRNEDTKEDSFGLRYAETRSLEVEYWIKNNSGKVEYFLPWDLNDDDEITEIVRNCTRIDGVPLTRILAGFIIDILGRDELMKRSGFNI